MTEDYCNGLSVVPLEANHFILSPSAASAEHPWRGLYQVEFEIRAIVSFSPTLSLTGQSGERVCEMKRRRPVFLEIYYQERRESPPTAWTKMPSIDRPPCEYTRHDQLLAPQPADPTHDTYTSYYNYRVKREVELPETIRLCDVEEFRKSLFTSSRSTRNVIYRYINVIKDSFALLEAIHFELFMPDRPDLRFLAVPLSTVPERTVGGDYFFISDVALLPNPSFGVKLGGTLYPVLFAAKLAQKVVDGRTTNVGLAYIVKKAAGAADGEVVAVSEMYDRDFSIAGAFPDHSLVDVTSRDILPAHLFPVEPPLKQRPGVSDCSAAELVMVANNRPPPPPFDYLTRVSGVRTCSQRAGRVATAFVPSASEVERIEDRLGAFAGYGQPGGLALMRALFGLGCVFRSHASSRADAQDVGETRIDESVIIKTLADRSLAADAECRPLLDCIYGR
ncbi:hypothetical protein PRIPAC_76968 [Pristionchus pacificus]|nr:hypothetical protein PRIPAC_76968 [Pristionchus pacificus]